jgi:hypothetical protein
MDLIGAAVTEFTREAQQQLRDPSNFSWTTVTLIALVSYVYSVEVERRNYSAILAGLSLWLMDWINEVANALVLHFTDRAAIWTATGDTSYQLLIGLNLEISLMFLVAGIVFVKSLPPDPKQKLLGLPNRAVFVLGFSVFSVAVEELLHTTGYFDWEYWWWNSYSPPLIVLFGYATFYAVAAWVYDMTDRSRQIKVVAALAAIDIALIGVFGFLLGWV